MILRRRFVSSFGLGLLVACGSGAATSPPGPSNQDPSPNASAPLPASNRAPGNTQAPAAPTQRPVPAGSGIPRVVGPIDSAGGSGAEGGGANPGDGGRGNGNDGGRGNSPGSGNPAACKPADFCANCSADDCLGSCNCVNQLGSTLDCATLCN